MEKLSTILLCYNTILSKNLLASICQQAHINQVYS